MKNFARLKPESPFYDLFQNGLVPIRNISVPSNVELEGSDETSAYMVDLEKCGPSVVREICQRLSERSAGVAIAEIFDEVMSRGLPLRASQVDMVSTDVPFFL